MKVMLYIYVFIFCACIGSFANVLIYRLPKGENFIIGRSYCPKCHHTLKMSEMIPIFSWILLQREMSLVLSEDFNRLFHY